jgi:cytoskeletal protein RodZ
MLANTLNVMFETFFHNSIPLAQGFVRSIGKAVETRKEWSYSLWVLGAAVLALVAILLLAAAIVWVRRLYQEVYEDPQKLFQSLCSLHGLNKNQQFEITTVARENRIDDPSKLFVDPALWFAAEWIDLESNPRDGQVLDPESLPPTRQVLLRKLFGPATNRLLA